MTLEYPAILDRGMRGQRLQYDAQDAMLYALAIGAGSPPDDKELYFVYEKNLRIIPSFASTVAWHAGLSIQQLGLNYERTLHAAEEIILHRPLPSAAKLLVDTSIKAVYDKGKDSGALIVREAQLIDAADLQPIATVRKTLFARSDGGCGGTVNEAPQSQSMPQRARDKSLRILTRPDQALLYRLCGDCNPLHADPTVAHTAGFDGPILHGLCTYGIACHAIVREFCDNDPAKIYSHSVRFAAPVYPGDILTIDLWRDGNVILFEVRVNARAVTVIRNGKTVLRAD
jgi:acyl dehydratase